MSHQAATSKPRMTAVTVSDGKGGHMIVLREAPAKKADKPKDAFAGNQERKAEALRRFVSRIEAIEAERAEVSEQIFEVKGEAKSLGFDRKALTALIRLRRINPQDRAEQEAMLEEYLCHIGES
jgi:uncharacterized protein (UPF0335 family)